MAQQPGECHPAPPVIFLMGSTACGKTDLATSLTERFPVELISVDAAQIYRGMDIGTAKPSRSFLQRYPHHLIDIRNVSETYSAADFVADARQLIDGIHQRRRIPLLVGGTMFYFHALEFGLSPLPPSDPLVRSELLDEVRDRGIGKMHEQLRSVDPLTAARIDANDTQRVLRALEIYRLTGKSPHALMSRAEGLPESPIKLALFYGSRERLHQRIRIRFEAMLRLGLIQEVVELSASLAKTEQLTSMRSVGYRQVLEMLQGKTGMDEMTERAIAATRQLAKRQLTWLRQQRGLVWVKGGHNEAALKIVSEYFLSQLQYQQFMMGSSG